jgi:hypothetical protein
MIINQMQPSRVLGPAAHVDARQEQSTSSGSLTKISNSDSCIYLATVSAVVHMLSSFDRLRTLHALLETAL